MCTGFNPYLLRSFVHVCLRFQTQFPGKQNVRTSGTVCFQGFVLHTPLLINPTDYLMLRHFRRKLKSFGKKMRSFGRRLKLYNRGKYINPFIKITQKGLVVSEDLFFYSEQWRTRWNWAYDTLSRTGGTSADATGRVGKSASLLLSIIMVMDDCRDTSQQLLYSVPTATHLSLPSSRSVSRHATLLPM